MINRDELPEIPANAEWNTPSGSAPEPAPPAATVPTPPPAPAESRLILTERLKREGRWEEASLWKDGEIKRQREYCHRTKLDAGERAWAAMAEKFPPLPEPKEPDIGIMLESAEGDQMPADLIGDILWCYSNMNRKVTPQDAPTGGAWGLLQWARKYQIKFYETLVPKALANRPPADEENQRAERKSVAEIRKIIETYGKGK